MSEDRARYMREGETKTLDVLTVIEGQIEGLEKASADCTNIEEKINVADAIIRLVNTSNYYLTKKAIGERAASKSSDDPRIEELQFLAQCLPPMPPFMPK